MAPGGGKRSAARKTPLFAFEIEDGLARRPRPRPPQLHKLRRAVWRSPGVAALRVASRGAPLQCFVGDPNTWLSVQCEGCGAARPFTFERMIHALQVAGRGDGNTSVRAVGERLKRPCRDCRGVRWRVEIVREHAPGSGSNKPLQRPKGGKG